MNSMALLVLIKQGKLKVDIVIFADPGAELPETYEHLEKYVKPLCKELGIKFVTIPGLRKGLNLLEYCKKYKIFPSRKFRACTQHHKFRPILKWIDENIKEDFKMILGIDYGEKHRAERIVNRNNSDYKEGALLFPLIEMKIDRKGCKRIIKKAGYPCPVKSGCYFCPFKSTIAYRWLFEQHPDIFAEAEELERVAVERYTKNYPDKKPYYLMNDYPMSDIRLKRDDNTKQSALDGGEACVFCHL